MGQAQEDLSKAIASGRDKVACARCFWSISLLYPCTHLISSEGFTARSLALFSGQ
jgi:hypothetical protein